MRANILKILLIAVLLVVDCEANLPDDPVEYGMWQSKMLEAIQVQASLPPEQLIPKLGSLVARLSQDRTPNSEKGDKPVLNAARAALLAIPGHAEYYQKAIKDLQFKLENAPRAEKNNYRNDYSRLQWESFEILGKLPSPETVRVLGDFVADENGGIDFSEVVGGIPNETQITTAQKKNCDQAVSAFYKLIANPPVKEVDRYNYKNIETWRLWYEQVKAGNRVYQFKGNLTEYDLEGPAPKEKLVRIERDRKRDEGRLAGKKRGLPGGEGASESEEAKPFPIVAILAAVALGMAAGWYFLRGRKVT